MMSSEESDLENDDVIIVKPLPWRSPRVDKVFHELDAANENAKSKQAVRQKRKRVTGTASSDRPKPDNLPKWALC